MLQDHGGFSHDDQNVLLLVKGAGYKVGKMIDTPVTLAQVHLLVRTYTFLSSPMCRPICYENLQYLICYSQS